MADKQRIPIDKASRGFIMLSVNRSSRKFYHHHVNHHHSYSWEEEVRSKWESSVKSGSVITSRKPPTRNKTLIRRKRVAVESVTWEHNSLRRRKREVITNTRHQESMRRMKSNEKQWKAINYVQKVINIALRMGIKSLKNSIKEGNAITSHPITTPSNPIDPRVDISLVKRGIR